MGATRDHGLRLQLRFRLDPGERGPSVLHSLPWELLYNPVTRDFLALSRLTPVVRYLEVARPASSVRLPSVLRILVVIDEYTRECLALRVGRRLGSLQVIETLADVMLVRGIREHIRSDNGPEFIARELQHWLANVGTRTLYIERGSPLENGYCESFNGKLRDELLNGEIFYSLKEAQILIERWRQEYNTERPHSALGYRPPAPVAAFRPAASSIVQPRVVM